jgi:hypothetical protein
MTYYFDSKKQDEQEFVIDTAGTDPIVGNQGTKIWPDKEKLMYANGDSVQWPYTVKLIELYTPKDMLYYQMQNVSSNNYFSCKGEVRVRALKNGEELVLRPNESWDIEMPATTPIDNVKVYYGDKTSEIANWNSSAEIFTTTTTGYHTGIAPLGWTAAGLGMSNELGITTSFTSTTDNLETVHIFMYLPSKESLIEVFNQQSIGLPTNEDVKIIIMAIDKSGKLFSFYKETKIGTDTSIDVTLTEISDTDLNNKLDNL